jgi:Domain of unknown function (DUF4352)
MLRVLLASCLVAAGVAACSSDGSAGGGRAASTTSSVAEPNTPTATDTSAACPPVPATRSRQVRDGNLLFEVLEVQAPIGSIIGTHAEFNPQGQYVRVRVAVTNNDSVFHELDTDMQRLVDGAGREYEPSVDAMRIKRQPERVDIGSRNRLELDVWFDIPRGATPHVLVAHGDGCGRGLVLPRARP